MFLFATSRSGSSILYGSGLARISISVAGARDEFRLGVLFSVSDGDEKDLFRMDSTPFHSFIHTDTFIHRLYLVFCRFHPVCGGRIKLT